MHVGVVVVYQVTIVAIIQGKLEIEIEPSVLWRKIVPLAGNYIGPIETDTRGVHCPAHLVHGGPRNPLNFQGVPIDRNSS